MNWSAVLNAVCAIHNGDLRPFGGPQVPPAIVGRFRAAQVGTIARFTPAVMLANIFNATILILAFWQQPYMEHALVWGFLVISVSLYIYLRRRDRACFINGRTTSVRAIHACVRNGIGLGALWALPPVWLFVDASPAAKIVIVALCIGQICGGAFTLAAVPAAGLAFTAPIILASGVALTLTGEPVYFLITGLLVAYAMVIMRAMFIYASQLATRFIAELENESAARTDPLTQAPNRIAFSERLSEITQRARRFGETHAVFFLDLDHFKVINDTYGHAAGDEFLIEVAKRLRMCVQAKDLVARISGDEFAIIAMDIDRPEKAAAIAQRIQRLFDLPFSLRDDVSLTGSATIGIAMLPWDGVDNFDVMQKADEALYAAKRDGRGSFRFVNSMSGQNVRQRQALAADLREAVTSNQLRIVYQPIRELESLEVNGYEALLRWDHPELGEIGPLEFIPLAEEKGLTHEIGEWAIRNAIMEASFWPEHLRVSINVSATQFRSLEIASIIELAIREARIRPSRVEVEVNESLALADIETTRAALERLRLLGVGISLDDFGAGYASLSHLVRLPIGRIKIDQYFVHGAAKSEECMRMLRAIIRLAREFNLNVIAEGVETPEQLAILRSLGCQDGQGFFLGEPGDVMVPALRRRPPAALASAA